MIDGERDAGKPAVLAAMAIASKNVLTRKDHPLERDPNIARQADHTWEWHRDRRGMDLAARHRGDQFSLAEIDQNDRLLDRANDERFVIAVEDKHLAVESADAWEKIIIIKLQRVTQMAVIGAEFGPCRQTSLAMLRPAPGFCASGAILAMHAVVGRVTARCS